MDFVETEPLRAGWNRRTALLGTERMQVPVRVYALPFLIQGKQVWAKGYILDRVTDWMTGGEFLEYMLAVKADVQHQGERMAMTRIKGHKEASA